MGGLIKKLEAEFGDPCMSCGVDDCYGCGEQVEYKKALARIGALYGERAVEEYEEVRGLLEPYCKDKECVKHLDEESEECSVRKASVERWESSVVDAVAKVIRLSDGRLCNKDISDEEIRAAVIERTKQSAVTDYLDLLCPLAKCSLVDNQI